MNALRPVLALVLGTAALLPTGAAAPHRAPRILAQVSPTAAAPTDDLRASERTFLLQGVEGSRRVEELARLAVSQAASSGLREFAQQLVSDYAAMNRSLETLARRKAVTLPLQPTSFSDEYRELANQAGTAFDRAFIEQVSDAAQRELQLCENAVANAKDAEVRALAGDLLPVLRDHVNKVTALRKAL